MLFVTRRQTEAFRSAALLRFTRDMSHHLRLLFAGQVGHLEERELHQQVQCCVEKARSYGVLVEGDVQRYLECSVLLGWDFDVDSESHWVGELLRDPALPGEVKMDRLEQGLLSMMNRSQQP